MIYAHLLNSSDVSFTDTRAVTNILYLDILSFSIIFLFASMLIIRTLLNIEERTCNLLQILNRQILIGETEIGIKLQG